MRRWDYDVATNLTTKDLELCGRNGWELVSVVREPPKSAETWGEGSRTIFYFKKEMTPL